MSRNLSARLEVNILPSKLWLQDHPGEDCPPDQQEVVILLVGLEARTRSVVLPGQSPGPPQAEVRGIPLRTLARVPLPLWVRTMDALFSGTEEPPPTVL